MSTRTGVLLVGAVDPVVQASAAGAFVLDLPQAVALTYEQIEGGAVRRRVGDATGLLYDEVISEPATCACCAVREDLVGAVRMLAEQRRWTCVVCSVPPASTLQPLAYVLCEAAAEDALGGAELSRVVQLVDLGCLEQDLLGDDLLDERGLALAPTDRRSVGEALVAGLEFADVVVGLDGAPGSSAPDLLGAVCDASTQIHLGWSSVDIAALAADRHDHEAARTRVHPLHLPGAARFDTGTRAAREASGSEVWTLELSSTRPLDPARLLESIELLGSGAVRGRGFFWLASRPDVACVWDGAGGQLSVGVHGPWEGRMPQTRIVVVGTDPDDRERVAEAFPGVCCEEPFAYPGAGEEVVDGFEPWLGQVEPWFDGEAISDVGSGQGG